LTLLFEGNPSPIGMKFYHKKTRVLGAADIKDFVILACTFLIQYSKVTDGQTDKWTDAQAVAKSHEAFCYRVS